VLIGRILKLQPDYLAGGEDTKMKKKKQPRGNFEIWLDCHNHKLELIRTIGNTMAGIAGAIAILKVIGVF